MAEQILQRSSTEMYIEDQTKYAVIVDRRRALPMAIDGLKVVQRRILYAAFKEGMTSFNKRQKSAALTGEVMKNFHPHCLHGSTVVYLANGKTTTMKDLYDNQRDAHILAYDTATHKTVPAIAHSFRIGQYSKKIYHIVLGNDNEILCTGNHRFLRWDRVWVAAEDLKDGDMLFSESLSIGSSNIEDRFEICINIVVEELEEEIPMYDFTVDGLENMMIPIQKTKDDKMIFIFAHNSESYSSIVTLAAWYKNKIPLIYGHGNWGNLMGDSAAAQRYTECALSQFGYECIIGELSESPNVVNWQDTYKRDKIKEPEYLPVKVPILLVNGCAGIGVGLVSNILPHNLAEVIDATIMVLRDPTSNPILVPDFCQACEIIDTDWVGINTTGSGKVKVRGIIKEEKDKKGDITLVISSLPDNVTTTQVYESILNQVEKKQLPMVKDVFNLLDDYEKPHIRIQLKQGADPAYIKQVLYAKCGVQKTESVDFQVVAPNGIDIRRMSYKEYLLSFIDQRMAIKFRLYCNKLQKLMTRYHYVYAFTRVLESGQIDSIISMIKKSKDTEEQMIEKVIKLVDVSDIQAKYILQANLAKLSKANLLRYKEECKELVKTIESLKQVVLDEKGVYIKAEIEKELLDIRAKYGTPRLCKVISKEEGSNIPKGIFKIVVTERNFIRKVPDVDKVGVVRKDNPKFIIRVDNVDNILLFDNKGKVFNLPASKIPISDKNSPGTDVRALVRNLTSDIIAVFDEEILKKISKSRNKHYFTVLTKSNTIKRLDIEDFLTVGASGLIYSKIRPEDEIVNVSLVANGLDLVVCSDRKALRMRSNDVPLYKRNATGAKAMTTNEPMEGLTVIYPDSSFIVAVTRNGKFNKFEINMFSCHARGGKGQNVLKLDATDNIFGIYAANDNDIIRLITSEGIEEVRVADIKLKSPIASGTKMVKTKGVIVKADVVR